MIVAYVCVYSSTRSSKRSSIEKETRKPFALASTKAFVRSAQRTNFRGSSFRANNASTVGCPIRECFPIVERELYNSVLKRNEKVTRFRVVRRSNDAINFLSTEEFTKKKPLRFFIRRRMMMMMFSPLSLLLCARAVVLV